MFVFPVSADIDECSFDRACDHTCVNSPWKFPVLLATKVTSSMAWLTVEVSHALWEFLCYKNNAHFLCSKETSNRKLMLVNPLALLGRILGKHFQ